MWNSGLLQISRSLIWFFGLMGRSRRVSKLKLKPSLSAEVKLGSNFFLFKVCFKMLLVTFFCCCFLFCFLMQKAIHGSPASFQRTNHDLWEHYSEAISGPARNVSIIRTYLFKKVKRMFNKFCKNFLTKCELETSWHWKDILLRSSGSHKIEKLKCDVKCEYINRQVYKHKF